VTSTDSLRRWNGRPSAIPKTYASLEWFCSALNEVSSVLKRAPSALNGVNSALKCDSSALNRVNSALKRASSALNRVDSALNCFYSALNSPYFQQTYCVFNTEKRSRLIIDHSLL
jgi:hypothetical protein